VKEDDIKKLAEEVDCVWRIYEGLMKIDSVGLPLQSTQIFAGQLVTLVIGKAPLAEGELVAHNGFWPSPLNGTPMKVTAAYAVIKITKLLVPGHSIAKHSQTLQWLADHGGHAIVQIRSLRSRSLTPPHPSEYDPSLGIPAPMNPPTTNPSWLISTVQPNNTITSEDSPEYEYDRDSVMSDGDEVCSQLIFATQLLIGNQDPDSLDHDDAENSTEDMFIEAIRHAQQILSQTGNSDSLASRVLDDAYHFMDRLVRLLSKKHSIFKEFARQFSETIFIRDQEDEANVRAVLEEKGIKLEYAICAKKSALNHRIRRYIPPPEKLAADLEILFNSFKNVCDSVDQANSRGSRFFSEEAQETANTLLETVRLGFLSDPPGISRYYIRGKDRDGLILYRTVRGTNSVEGGVHMLIRRIYGSLRASPELTEAIIANWFFRRNRRV
jgi:hypothetical protein